MKLNLGCGTQVPDGWVNVDYALGARFIKIPFFRQLNAKVRLFNLDWNEKIVLHDLTTPFPWADASADVIYSSHTLEHFSKEAGQQFLHECHRVLRNDGIIRIVVPDLHHIVREYTEGRIAADDFVDQLGVLYETTDNKLKNRLLPFTQFPHRCMYDETRLIKILDSIGFKTASRVPFNSDIDDLAQVELKQRTDNAVIVEGRKR